MNIPKRVRRFVGHIKLAWKGDEVYITDSENNELLCNAGVVISGSPPAGQLYAFGFGLPKIAARYLADAIANAQRDPDGKWWSEFLFHLAEEMTARCIPGEEGTDEARKVLERWEKEDSKPTTH